MQARDVPHRLGTPRPRRVVVLRALQLGDLLCAVPAFRALRATLPDAEIVLLGLPWAEAFVARYDRDFDGFRELPGFPGLPERASQVDHIPGFLAAMQAERFDLALQMHGSGSIVNPLIALLGARHVAGFFEPGGYRPDAERFLPYPDRGPEIRRHLRLMEFLGVPSQGEHLDFPVTDADRRALRSLAGAADLQPGRYACVHPGASVPERRWPAERFAAVADALAASGLRVVLTGTAAEADLTRAVARAMRTPNLDLAGKTDLGTVGALLEGACLLVCNDTGVSHLAAALSVPSVVISTGNNPERWAPLDRDRHRVLCSDAGVAVRDVQEQVEKLLRPGAVAATPPGWEASCAAFGS